ncbi:Cleft lip and palate transmembrane protein 1-like protein [Larimichthys crocea]|uniref:Uncharacterized protein n=1 Tax=Larimichthys crocea TaxID=215358 RepID=A0ACD3QUQ8_LARCR|nr:Cleft lip and palate transmembrane protein 1-like protein [Larimichthys crocea]
MFPSCCSKPADSGAKRSSIAKLLLGVFVVYTLHTVWLLYGFLNTKPCDGGRGEHCIASYLTARPRLQMSVFTCLVPDNSQLNLAVKIDPFDPHSTFERQVNVSLPEETRTNGTLYAVVYVHKAGVSPLEDSREVHYAAQLTTYITPTHTEGPRDMQKRQSPRSETPVSHWRPHLSITMMSEDFTFNKAGLPSDVRRYMRVSQDGRQMIYLPLLLVNELNFRVRDLMASQKENVDEIKETLVGSNLYLLVLTALVTALQVKKLDEEERKTVEYDTQGVNTLISDLCSCASLFSSSVSFSSSHQLSCFRDELLFFLYLYQRRRYAPKARRRESGTLSKKLKTQ